MRILLSNVPDAHVGKTTDNWDLEASDIGTFPPMGILYLAGALREHGKHEVKLLDCIADKLQPGDVADVAEQWDADVIGLTVYTPNLFDALILTRELKRKFPNKKLLWGGPHTSLFPEESMAQPEVDYLLTGECEQSLPAFLDALETGDAVSHIPGVWFRDGLAVSNTGAPAYVQDIDTLPYPAFELVGFKKYFSAIGTGLPVGSICSSRGCPFHCTFCCKPYSTYRSRSVNNILCEMQRYYDNGIREFFFFDDLFNASAKRVIEISIGIVEKGWFDIVWSFRGRVDAVDEEMLVMAKRAGCRQILFGVEDSTDEGLKAIKKKITLEQVRRAVRLCRKVGIVTSTNWIIGFPHHRTREDILRLIDNAVSIDSDFAQFNICIVYHGTEIFDLAVQKGLLDNNIWRKHAATPIPNFVEPIWEEHLSRHDLSELLIRCYRRFYFRPLSILRKLRAVRHVKELLLFVRGALTLLGIKGYRRKGKEEGTSRY